jgi:DNA-binding PucR family transcriptional regulator
MLTHDMDGLHSWVRGALGPLITDTASHQRLRETVHTFFAHDRHHAATAAALNIHRNTLKYRLEKAEAIRGRSLDADRLDLELALQVCQYLGDSVLE